MERRARDSRCARGAAGPGISRALGGIPWCGGLTRPIDDREGVRICFAASARQNRRFDVVFGVATIEVETSAMKQPSTVGPASEPPPQLPAVDTATLELLASWKAEDATTDPEKIRAADEEVDAFMKAMNENRAASGERLLFP